MRWFPGLLLLLSLPACGSQDSDASRPPAGKAGKASVGAVTKPQLGLDRSHAGAPAPDVAFEDPDGESASLADFRGKPLLLNLWATWCAPCIKELPTLDALAARERGALQVVTLSQDMEGREKVETFLAARKLPNVEPWLDSEMKVMTALGVPILPTTILYDAEGKEVWRFTGDEDWTSADVAKLIAEAQR